MSDATLSIRGSSARPGSRDNLPTVVALGVLAYLSETIGHEALGHGGVCLLTGGRITMLAFLGMRCSLQTNAMVLAGPMFNFALGGACAAALHRLRVRDSVALLLWFSSAFNLLVAFGYLMVGGIAGFGDWPYLLSGVQPPWAWRTFLAVGGLLGYLAALGGLGRLYLLVAGRGGFQARRLAWRTWSAGAGAAAIAIAGLAVGGGLDVGGLALSLGCTLFVGFTLSRVTDAKGDDVEDETPKLTVPFGPVWIALAVIASRGSLLLIRHFAA